MRAYFQVCFIVFVFVLSINAVIDQYGIPLAANNYLLVSYRTEFRTDEGPIQYQCLANRDNIFYANFNLKPVHSVSIGKAQIQSQLYFVLAGMINTSTPYMSKLTVNCNNDSNEMVMKETVFFQKQLSSRFVVAVDPRGRFAIGFTNNSFLFYDLVNLQHFSTDMAWPKSRNFLPLTIDISDDFIYVVGYSIQVFIDEEEEEKDMFAYRTDVYLFSINAKHEMKFHDMWATDRLITDPLMKIAVSVDCNDEKVLVGLPSNDTVHLLTSNKTSKHLRYVGSKTRLQEGRFRKKGYGWSVGWLNDGQKAVILNIDSFGDTLLAFSTSLEYYETSTNNYFNDNATPFSSFPNLQQTDQNYNQQKIIFLVTTLSFSLYAMNDKEGILVLLSSRPGFYSVEFLSLRAIMAQHHMFPLIPNSAQCRPGTYKNDSGIWPCRQCQVDEMDNSSFHHFNNSISATCPQCTEERFCPLESIIDIQHWSDVEQYNDYPKSPEVDDFNDILMQNMFRTKCFSTSPFFFSMIVLSIVCILSMAITLMKLFKRFASKQQCLVKLLRHLDLIEQGHFWFGGLISIALLVLSGFAIKFGFFYYHKYPIENQQIDSADSCQSNNLLNAKFETNLQFLNSPPGQLEQIFNLLNSQEFTVHVELINTTLHCGRLLLRNVRQSEYLPFTCYTNGFTLYASAKLPTHTSNLLFTLSDSETIDAIRISLTGPGQRQLNNYIQKLNISKVFNQTNRILTRKPLIDIQLTKVINITEGLTNSDNTMYSGLWLPTFAFDNNQLFIDVNSSDKRTATSISLVMGETSFFIQNKQKPIARSSEITFSVILFICACIELLCMIFLLLKLWFNPMIKLVLHKLFPSNSWIWRLIHQNTVHISKDIIDLRNELNDLRQKIETISTIINGLVREHAI